MIGDTSKLTAPSAAPRGLATFETDWTDLRVRALGPDAAVSSFLFRDSIVTAAGDVTTGRGPTTLVWERRGPGWLIVHGDADHYATAPSRPP